MFSSRVRIVLIGIAAILGVALLLQHRWQGVLPLAAALLWAWGYARHSAIYAAVAAYRRGDVERTRVLLQEVPDPARLTAQDRAYYHWLRGSLFIHDAQLEAAKPELELAVQGQLRTENDRCLVYCQLAELALLTKEFSVAREYLQQARTLRRRPQVEGILQQLEARLKGVA